MRAEDVLYFWFEEAGPSAWWIKSSAFDGHIERRFGAVHKMAVQGELFQWRNTGRGRLAEIIVLDQFSRNIYRDQPQSFASDTMALTLAQEAVGLGIEHGWKADWRQFLYMPYMHSESGIIHRQAVELFKAPGLENNLDFEYKHKEIIDRFGRYPHRNAILGRSSTAEEIEFLKQPGSSF